ncbi:hypothetical protein [Burkholderia glumae]|uniref:Uncharacterized protein n=1 Tax=Burkholderia glumae TaxID=337 RepID=A0AAQ0BTN3_BURGL|nr:hypothetical protein [Burkholderia glumae]AJY67709.1 hypothetical protein KS03_2753 [Burkholderia glumae LMG 2196 = ATCC 33617]KHJ63035.1 hypothetical protein NCPPB3923_10345 [Burkholderia glumae]MCM2483141.1 hypothetical protein [Burkholderia glumae]MCM2506457.1 hypothetical protein [Burkholderia glumae]MCM2538128.1 hypothetical protein [Burkholderia glumae]
MTDTRAGEGMELAAILARVRDALVEFNDDADLAELGNEDSLSDTLESFTHFAFLMSLEEKFNLTIPDHEFTFSKMGTLAAIARVLSRYAKSGPDA